MDIKEINLKVRSGNKFFLYSMTVPLGVVILGMALIMNLFPDNMPLLLIFSSVVIAGVPIITYFLLKPEKLSDVFVIDKVSLKNIVYIVAISIFIQPVMSFLASISLPFSEDLVGEMITELTKYPFLFSLITIALVPAVCEELLMRGVVLKFYEDLPLKKMAVINGFLFGVLHTNIQQFLYAFLLGFVFVYMYKLTGSILSPIISHFVINGSQICLTYIVEPQGYVAPTPDVYETLAIFLFAIPFAIITYILFKKFIKENQEKYDEIAERTEAIKSEKIKFFDRWMALILVVYFVSIAL